MTHTLRVLDPDGSEPDLAEITHDTLLPFGVRAAGPVMPEVPSEAVIVAAFTCAGIPDDANDDEYRSDFKGLWSAIRSALMQEQS